MIDERHRQIVESFRERLGRPPALLYAIVDIEADVARAQALALALLDAGVDALQLRAKSLAADSLAELAEKILPAAVEARTPFLLNDRIDVAVSVRAHGAHVGQEDLPPSEARALLGSDRILGLSTHSLDELREAQGSPVDYLGFGSIFETGTREGSRVVGVESLTAAAAASTLPLVAIGGLTVDRAAACAASGCAGVAAVSALAPASRCRAAVQAFRESLRGREGPSGSEGPSGIRRR